MMRDIVGRSQTEKSLGLGKCFTDVPETTAKVEWILAPLHAGSLGDYYLF